MTAAGTKPFDPAAWLDRAERLGFVFSVIPRVDGSLRLQGLEPDAVPDHDSDIALFRELQPDAETGRRNRQALREHLRDIGCIGWPEVFGQRR